LKGVKRRREGRLLAEEEPETAAGSGDGRRGARICSHGPGGGCSGLAGCPAVARALLRAGGVPRGHHGPPAGRAGRPLLQPRVDAPRVEDVAAGKAADHVFRSKVADADAAGAAGGGFTRLCELMVVQLVVLASVSLPERSGDDILEGGAQKKTNKQHAGIKFVERDIGCKYRGP